MERLKSLKLFHVWRIVVVPVILKQTERQSTAKLPFKTTKGVTFKNSYLLIYYFNF